MSWVEDWTVVAACRGMDPDELFVQGAAQNRAKTVCSGCPVRTECLADALDNRVEYGVWGGMTERERRALLRRRPEVRSWRQFLESAKEKYERGDEVVCEPRFAAAAQATIPRQRDEAGSFGRA
jgi:WhiB family redox-sensing transcriptional regulator